MDKTTDTKRPNRSICINSTRDIQFIDALMYDESYLRTFIPASEGNKVDVYVASDYTEQLSDKLSEFIKFLRNKNIRINLIVNKSGMNITNQEASNMAKTEEEISTFDGRFLIESFPDERHSLKEVLDAQIKANDIVEPLRNSTLSPFEKYLVIYNFLTSKVYKENDEDKSKARDIISVLNGDDIVCVGYASLMKYLCEQVGIPCAYNHVIGKKQGEEYTHANNIVCIDDDKYDIHGIFYADACWDARMKSSKGEVGQRLNFCLIPLSDMGKINDNGYRLTLASPNDENNAFFRKDVDTKDYLDFLIDCDWINNKDSMTMFMNMIMPDAQDYLNQVQDYAHKLTRDYQLVADACDRLDYYFKKCKVKDDIYNMASVYPVSLRFETLLALCLQKDPDEEMIMGSIEKLKKYVSEYTKEHNDAKVGKNKYKKISRQLEDYKYALTKFDRLKDAICNIEISDILSKRLPSKLNCQPIETMQYVKALETINKISGIGKEESDRAIEEILNNTIVFSQCLFDKGALNAFFEEYSIISQEEKA